MDVTPIPNVSDPSASPARFEAAGWTRTFARSEGGSSEGSAEFAGAGSTDVVLFPCLDGRGARGSTEARQGAWAGRWGKRAEAVGGPPRNGSVGVHELVLTQPVETGLRVFSGRSPEASKS